MGKNSVYPILQFFKVLSRAGHNLYATKKNKSTALRKRKPFCLKYFCLTLLWKIYSLIYSHQVLLTHSIACH